VIKTEYSPSCIAKFEIIPGYCAFDLTSESNQRIVSRRNAVINLMSGPQPFYQLSQ